MEKNVIKRICFGLLFLMATAGLYAQDVYQEDDYEQQYDSEASMYEMEEAQEQQYEEAAYYDDGTDLSPLTIIFENSARADELVFGFLEGFYLNLSVSTGCYLTGFSNYSICTPAQFAGKFTSPWVLDSTPFERNQLLHPYLGSLYFNAARANNLSFFQSFLYTALDSLLWETVFMEGNVSVNDLITTTLAGSLWGEVMHRLSFEAENFVVPLNWLVSPADGITDFLKHQQSYRPNGGIESMYFYAGAIANLGKTTYPGSSIDAKDTSATVFNMGLDLTYGDPYCHNTLEVLDLFEMSTALTFGMGRLYLSADLTGYLWSYCFLEGFSDAACSLALSYNLDWGLKTQNSRNSLLAAYRQRIRPGNFTFGWDFMAGYIFLDAEGDYYVLSGDTANGGVAIPPAKPSVLYEYMHGPEARLSFFAELPHLGTIRLNGTADYLMNYSHSMKNTDLLGGLGEFDVNIMWEDSVYYDLGFRAMAGINCRNHGYKTLQKVTEWSEYAGVYVQFRL